MRKEKYTESDDLYDMACEWIETKEFDKASECLKGAINLNPNFIYAYVTLAEVYEKQKRFSEGVTILKKAFKIDTTFDRLPFLISRYCFELGNLPDAMKYIDLAIELAPEQEYLEFKERIKNA